MYLIKTLLLSAFFILGSLVTHLQQAGAEESFFKTESIRQKLFGRMDDRKKSKPLRTINENILIGVFSRVSDSESVWVRIESRAEFRKWTFKLSKQNLNLARQEVRVWLKNVSPKLSVSHGKEYNEWFRKKAAFEMQKIFYNRQVRISFDFSENLFRLDGMIWTGDTNINIWLVRNGWSFYLLDNEPPPEHQDFLAAENEAKQRQVGLWKAELQ
ncbi:MAG: thermonuclease family protein [SAR324 cluster bacterium]|nr:thermonuclease family protein [SAR324 cluster bacterium]MBL7034915.1 thermonuclease family protein [SAR324 cluster bacterium]